MNKLDSIKINSSGFNKLERSSLEKEIVFDCVNLNRVKSSSILDENPNFPNKNIQNQKLANNIYERNNQIVNNFILNSHRLVEFTEVFHLFLYEKFLKK